GWDCPGDGISLTCGFRGKVTRRRVAWVFRFCAPDPWGSRLGGHFRAIGAHAVANRGGGAGAQEGRGGN
ncbi:MAG: hypothetical protein O3C57_07775, partial [Verrucomicrobia bacterium]|nr:hypothetical protein [Verrucomicrobiota bacterium]